MEPFVEKIRTDLNRTCRLLDDEVFLSFTPGESRQLKTQGRMFIKQLESIESGFLTMGLIGGTGVGKSTLMNALAGKEIAAAGDRRPYTDRVLIYKHETMKPQAMKIRHGVDRHEITHTSDEIQGIILCDLPDFDSILSVHRKQVIDFLEHLDVLVWVTSVEKYADRLFYEFLETVPKAKQNFCFVLNKADQCFDSQTARCGYNTLDGVVKSFYKHIQKIGITKPLLFPLSAKEAFDNTAIQPWNQFSLFSRHVFQQRDVKEITAIKAANIDVETRQYLSLFQKEWQNLNIFDQILETTLKEISERRVAWFETGQKAILHWIDQHLRPSIVNRQGDVSCLTGPGYGIGLLFEAWSHRVDPAGGKAVGISADDLSRDMAALFKQRIQWLTERLRHQRMYHSLPEPFEEKTRQAIAPETLLDDLTDRFRQVFSFDLSEPKGASRLFVAGQRLSYGIVFLLFLLAIGGETAWHQLVETPGWQSIFHLMISMFHTLFSGRGLAALGSLALLYLFLGFRFFHRFRKRRKKAADRVLDALATASGSAWQETLETMNDRIGRLREEIHRHIKDFSDLHKNI
jgi:GTPase Era involved in 16S rRNA processing